MTPTEELILNGIHILMRATFSPNETTAQAKHFQSLQKDISAWMGGYSATMAAAKGPEHY